MTTTLTARWVFPVKKPPLEGGTITIDGERIVAVEPHGPRTPDRDLGDVAIVPGFVNAHTHLDLSDAAGKCPPSPDFAAWLMQVIAHRLSQTPEDVRQAIADGVAQLLRTGTTLAGDVSGQGASWEPLEAAPLRAVVYHEVLGLTSERARETLAAARAWIGSRPRSSKTVAGISPHAPYSTGALVFDEAAKFAEQSFAEGRILPMAIHLGETDAEIELIHKRTGPLAEFLKGLGLWGAAIGAVFGAGGLIEALSVLELCFGSSSEHLWMNPPVLIHANHLPAVDFLSPEEGAFSPVVYCPRTHAAFGHPPHPFLEFQKRGVPVALGTDSLASNPDLDVLAEARFLAQRRPEVPGATILRMLTLDGARVLGGSFAARITGGSIARVCGSLVPGKEATFVVLPLPRATGDDPHDLLFHSDLAPTAVFFRGQERSLTSPDRGSSPSGT
jgi:cytosine/adenosine deaminase-related metal-dependent hydrolase